MDDRRIEPRADFAQFNERFTRVVGRLARMRPDARDTAIAAE